MKWKKYQNRVKQLCFAAGMLAAGMISGSPQEAEAVEVTEGNFVFEADYYNYTASLKEYTGEDLQVIVPSTVDGCTVTRIDDQAFYDYWNPNNMESIILPGTIKEIGGSAFRNCKEIKTIEIPSSVSTIEGGAFMDCTSLEKIVLPDSVISLGNAVFRGCSSLSQVTLPDSMEKLNESLLEGCSSLENITIPSSVKELSYRVFRNCTALKTITIPDSVTSMGSEVFNGCGSLEKIVIPSSVQAIRYDSFEGCSSLSQLVIPGSVSTIESGAFSGCVSLNTVLLPSSVNEIGNNAFGKCTNLKKVVILGNPRIVSSFPQNAEIVIYGIKGSQTEDYCKGAGIHFTGFEAPVLAEAAQKGKGISLQWSGVSNAKSYAVYRRDSSSDVYTLAGTANGLSYQDTNVKSGTTYYYMVGVTYDFEGVTLEDVRSGSKAVYYEYVSKPQKAPVIKLRKDGYRLTVKIKKQKVQYFQLQYSTSRKFPAASTQTLAYSGDSTSAVIYKSNFLLKKKYYIRVRAYNKDSKSNAYYGKWSQVKNFKFQK